MNPLLLAVDTTHEFGSLALARCDQIVEELPLRAPDGFAHVIYGALDALLKRNSIALDAIDCFASASGPGSFTGVRVGLACIKGLAEACGKPAIAVSNLEALASFGSAPLRAAVLDARRGEVYAAVYDSSSSAGDLVAGGPSQRQHRGGQLVVPETVTRFPAWLQSLPPGDLEFVSTDFTAFCDAFAGTRFENASRVVAPRALASAIARIACRRFLAGAASDPAALDANYVRRSDAELFWKE